MRFLALLLLTVVAGCGKKDVAPPPPPPGPAPAQGNAGVDPRNTNYKPGAGVVQNVRNAAKRTYTDNDLKQLGIFITQMQLENNKMPSPAEVKDYIRRDAPKILAAIDDGTLILIEKPTKEGLWAYEVDADKVGGLTLVNGTASRSSADEVKKLLGK